MALSANVVWAAETAETWLFNGTLNGWTGSSGTSLSSTAGTLHVVFATGGGIYTPIFNYIPGPNTYHRDYIRFAYQIPSGSTVAQLQFNFSTLARQNFSSPNLKLSGLIRDGEWHYVTFRVDSVGDWKGGGDNPDARITQLRFIALGTGGGGASGTMNFDFMALRRDSNLPQDYDAACPRSPQILSPPLSSWFNGSIIVTVKGNDPPPYLFPTCGTTPPDEYGSGVSAYRYTVNSTDTTLTYWDQDAQWPDGWSQLDLPVSARNLNPGPNTFRVHAYDRVGFQATTSTSWTLNYDPNPPSVALVSAQPGTYRNDVSIAFTLDDHGLSGVRGFAVTWDNPTRPDQPTSSGSSGAVALSSSGAPYVPHTLYVHSYDNAGNGGTTAFGPWIYAPDHLIQATAGEHGVIVPGGAVGVAHGASQSFTITPDDCYRVADIRVDGNSVGTTSPYDFSNVQQDHTIAASFALQSFTISATTGAHGSISPSGDVRVGCGGSVTFTFAPDSGYTLVRLTVDGSEVTPDTTYPFTNVRGDHTIAATFADVTPPTVEVTLPHAGYVCIVSTPLPVQWTATDGAGVTSIDITYLGGDMLTTEGSYQVLATGLDNTGSWVWPAAAGTYVAAHIQVTAHDAAGNVGYGWSDRFILTGPTATLLEEFAATPCHAGIQLRWRFTDPTQVGAVTVERATVTVGPWDVVAVERQEEQDMSVAIDRDVVSNQAYWYRIVTTMDNATTRFGPVSATAPATVDRVTLEAPTPNPTRSVARITFALPQEATISLGVFDIRGRRVATLADGSLGAGWHSVDWSAMSDGQPVPAGVYFVRLHGAGVDLRRRLVRIR